MMGGADAGAEPPTPYRCPSSMTQAGKFAQPFREYEILERLGSGGMGTVFKAQRRSDGGAVAIKVLRPSLSRNARYVERLRREADISIRLDHEGLVKGHGIGEEGGYHYVVMEFVAGRTLRELLKSWGHFPEDLVVDLGLQLADALAYAHENGVIHRDVKPGNVLVDDHDHAKLTDLGLAKAEVGSNADARRCDRRHTAVHEPRAGQRSCQHRRAQRPLLSRRDPCTTCSSANRPSSATPSGRSCTSSSTSARRFGRQPSTRRSRPAST